MFLSILTLPIHSIYIHGKRKYLAEPKLLFCFFQQPRYPYGIYILSWWCGTRFYLAHGQKVGFISQNYCLSCVLEFISRCGGIWKLAVINYQSRDNIKPTWLQLHGPALYHCTSRCLASIIMHCKQRHVINSQLSINQVFTEMSTCSNKCKCRGCISCNIKLDSFPQWFPKFSQGCWYFSAI